MPRKHRRAPEPTAGTPSVFGAEAPEWARADGFEVRVSLNPKVYRCPGCDHEIRGGVQHLVVVPRSDVSDRRHWHADCWRRELRRLGP